MDATEAPRPESPLKPVQDLENSALDQTTASDANPEETKTQPESQPKSDPKTSAKKLDRRTPFGGRPPFPHFPPYYYMNSIPYGTTASAMSYYGPSYGFTYGSPYSSPYFSPGTRYMDSSESVWYPDSTSLSRTMTDHPMLNRRAPRLNWPAQDLHAPYEFELSSQTSIANGQYYNSDFPYSAANRPNSSHNWPDSYSDQAFSARSPRKTRFHNDKNKRDEHDRYGGNEEYWYHGEIETKPAKHKPLRKLDSSKQQQKVMPPMKLQKRAEKVQRHRGSLRAPPPVVSPPATIVNVDTFEKSAARTVYKPRNEDFDFEEPLHGQGELRLPPIASSDHTKARSYSYNKASSKGRTT